MPDDQGPSSRTAHQRLSRADPAQSGKSKQALPNLIVIGASAGGIEAIATILESIPKDIPAAIVLILHQREDSNFQMAETVRRLTHLPVVTVSEGTRLRKGVIYIPSPGFALSFERRGILESSTRTETRRVTTINRTFSSAADAFGDRVIGVILTGLLKDGTRGLEAVHEGGGLSIVQNPRGAEYPDMPTNAMKNLPVTFCLDLPDIGPALDLLARRSSRLESGIAVSLRILKKRTELLVRLQSQSWMNEGASKFLEEELFALKRDLESITRLVRTADGLRGKRP